MAVGAEEKPEGSVTTRVVAGNIVETIYVGRITPEMAMQVRRDIEPHLIAIQGMDWLLDTSASTHISPAPREATTGVIDLFKKHGGRRIACVIPHSAIRMVVSALAFGTGLPMRIFANRKDALAYLRGTSS